MPRARYFDRTFKLADAEILLIIAIDRFFRLRRAIPRPIVEYSTLRPWTAD